MTNAMILVTKKRRAPPLRQEAASLLQQYAAWLGFSLVAVFVTALSTARDHAGSGASTHGWEPYVWELTSWFGYALVAPALLVLDMTLARRGVRITAAAPIHAAVSLAFSAVHITVMMSGRALVYAVVGDHYTIGSFAARFAYEYPKDIIPYLMLLGMAFLWRRNTAKPERVGAAPPSFLVREGGKEILILAHQIDWVEAQGNYAALYVDGRAYLVRRTLRDLEARLDRWGFIRTHRSALVRISQVRAIASGEDGGLLAVLADGQCAPVSQGRRQALRAALASPECDGVRSDVVTG